MDLDKRKRPPTGEKRVFFQELRRITAGSEHTQRELAKELNVDSGTMSRYLSERVPPRAIVVSILGLCKVTDEVRSQVLRLRDGAAAVGDPELRERLENADKYDQAVEDLRQAEDRFERLEDARQRLADEYENVARDLRALENAQPATRNEYRSALRGLRNRLRQERRQHKITLEELEAQRAAVRDLRQQLQATEADLVTARRERDEARYETARLRDELTQTRAHVTVLEEEQHRREREDTVVEEALTAVEEALSAPPSEPAATAETVVAGPAANEFAGSAPLFDSARLTDPPQLFRAASNPDRDAVELREQALRRSPAGFLELYARMGDKERSVMREALEERDARDRGQIWEGLARIDRSKSSSKLWLPDR